MPTPRQAALVLPPGTEATRGPVWWKGGGGGWGGGDNGGTRGPMRWKGEGVTMEELEDQ